MLFVPERYTPFRQVIGRHLHFYLISGKDLDVVHTHLPRDVGGEHVAVVQLDAEHRVGQGFDNRTVPFNSSLFAIESYLFIACSMILKSVSTSGPSLRTATANS